MTKYRALITDLDGTAVRLSSDGSDVAGSTQESIRKAQKAGYKIACATGRRWKLTKPIVIALGITDACIVEGGTRIVDPKTEKTLWEKHLDASALAAILDIFKRESNNKGNLSTFNITGQSLVNYSSVANDSRFMYLLGIEPKIAHNISNVINGQGFAVAHTTISWSGGSKLDVHVTHPEATKEHALLTWHKIEKVTKDETIGMGDSGNDVPLFQSAALKVAVSNATDELKRLADYVAPNGEQQALDHVITRFLL